LTRTTVDVTPTIAIPSLLLAVDPGHIGLRTSVLFVARR